MSWAPILLWIENGGPSELIKFITQQETSKMTNEEREEYLMKENKLLRARIEWLLHNDPVPTKDCKEAEFACDFRINSDDEMCPCQWSRTV